MKKLFLSILLSLLFISPTYIYAQPMMGGQFQANPDDHTAREETEGKEIWEKLQAKQLECKNVTDEQYGALGEYFMGQSIGNTQRHALMNQMMTNMMGEEGEEQMHVAMGKRLSGCEPNAQVPSSGVSFMPMMNMMMGMMTTPLRQGSGGQEGGGNPMMGNLGWNNMMGGWNGFGLLGWIPMLLFWILLILGVVALLRYLGGSGRSGDKGKSPLDILKERYAKGEIDKKEFEQMKKDLV